MAGSTPVGTAGQGASPGGRSPGTGRGPFSGPLGGTAGDSDRRTGGCRI